MSFGCSVGDFVALGQLAWKIYKSCKDAPEGFKNVTQEVLSLHAVLKEVEETYSDATLSATQQSRLRILEDGCRAVLEDLQGILDRCKSLGTKTKRTWDRLGWGSNDISELRSRLISNAVLLTTFVNSSQIKVQTKLDVFMQEFRDGMREGSVVSTHTVDSLSNEDRQTWRAIRKELEDIGISVAAFDANKDFIVNWFRTAISIGAFDEQTAEDGSSSIFCEDDFNQSSEYPGPMDVLSQPLEDPEHETNLTPTSVDFPLPKLSPKAKVQIRHSPRVASPTSPSFCDVEDFGDLFKAVQTEDETKVRQLLESGVSINVKDGRGRTPLHLAVLSKLEGMAQLLLENGARIDEKDEKGSTALHWAARSGHQTIVPLLLKNGANINEKHGGGHTALHTTAKSGNKLVMLPLLQNGANVNEKDRKGNTALHCATKFGKDTVAQLLLEYGARIDEKDGKGNTALHCAAMNGHEMGVELLLKNGAKVEKTDKDGSTALHWAARSGNQTVVQLLLKYGAEINEKNRDGYTALHSMHIHLMQKVARPRRPEG